MTDPKTVTFNAPPQTEAQFRSARLGTRVVGATLGVAAIMLGLVACLWSLNFAIALAVSWGEAIKLGLIAVGATLALTGLPVGSAMMARSYPKEAEQAMQLWFGALVLSAMAMLLFVMTLSGDHAAEWSPRQVLAVSSGAEDGPARRLLVLAFGFMAIAGAGLLGRFAVLATAESYRLGEGTASATAEHAVPTIAEVTGSGALTPADAFSLWANGRLMQVEGGEVSGHAAYRDYIETCRLNGIEPMAQGKFGTLMTARAAGSDGQILKQKSNGVMVYRGWQLPQLTSTSEPVAFER